MDNKLRALHNDKRRAKKEHGCMWCGGTIEKGETYRYMALVNGPKAYSWKSHEKCEAVAEMAMHDMHKNTMNRAEFSEWIFRFPYNHKKMLSKNVAGKWDQMEFPEMLDAIWNLIK